MREFLGNQRFKVAAWLLASNAFAAWSGYRVGFSSGEWSMSPSPVPVVAASPGPFPVPVVSSPPPIVPRWLDITVLVHANEHISAQDVADQAEELTRRLQCPLRVEYKAGFMRTWWGAKSKDILKMYLDETERDAGLKASRAGHAERETGGKP